MAVVPGFLGISPERLAWAGLPVVLACAVVLGACRDRSGVGASEAEIRWREGRSELVSGARVLALPAGELAEASRPIITQDAGGTRLAFTTAAGDARLVYRVGEGLYLGPRLKAPVDLAGAPELERALGTLFDQAGERRAALVEDVAKRNGEAGLARLLIEGAHVEAPEWEATYAKLSPGPAAEVRAGLAALLEAGKPTGGLLRAVMHAPLREASRAPVLAARIRELTDPVREPRAVAVMLRALAASDPARAGLVGCEVLGRTPGAAAEAPGAAEPGDRPSREAVGEAALLAVAAAGVGCAHVAARLGPDSCLPYFRCAEAGPLSGRETSKQDEPLCTNAQLAAAVARELERSASEVVDVAAGTRAPLFALAALAATGQVPPAFTATHARRRYALAQPAEPACESGVAPGSACHCEEAVVRDQACRHPESKTVSVGVCKFDIDDKQKKLFGVVAALPP